MMNLKKFMMKKLSTQEIIKNNQTGIKIFYQFF